MTHVVQCPTCGMQHSVADEHVGQMAACVRCGGAFQIVLPGTASPPPLPPAPAPAEEGPLPLGTVAYAGYPSNTGKATAALVLGIISIPTCIAYGIPSLVCGILAVIFGSASRGMIRRGEMPPTAGSSAKAGLICGIVGLALSVLLWVLLIIGWFWLMGTVSSMRGMRGPIAPPPPMPPPSPSGF